MFDGNIIGEFIELVSKLYRYQKKNSFVSIYCCIFLKCPGKKIIQSWKTKQWPEWLYSTVTVDINQQEDHTKVKVTLVGVPKR